MKIVFSYRSRILGLSVMLALSLAKPVEAQQTKVLGISEAISLGIGQSKNLKLANLRVSNALIKQSEMKDNALPSLKVSPSVSRLYTIAQPDFKLPGMNSPMHLLPESGNTFIGTASAREGLFAGFKLKYGIQAAEYLMKATKFDLEKEKNEIVLNIINAYYNLYKVQATKKIIDENLNQVKAHLKDVQDFEKHGMATRNDVLKTQLQESNIEESRIELDNSIQVASYNLAIMLGLPEGTSILADSSAVFPTHELKSFEDYKIQAIGTRNELKAAEARIKAGEANVKSAEGNYYPQVGVNADYYFLYPGKDIGGIQIAMVGLGVSYNFSNLFTTKNLVAEARNMVQQVQLQQDMLSDGIKLEVNQSFNSYLSALKRAELNVKTVSQAEENYRIAVSRYNNHIALLTDMLDANVAVLQAKVNLLLSRTDAEIAWSKLMKSTGASEYGTK